jgi:hypothetical protein
LENNNCSLFFLTFEHSDSSDEPSKKKRVVPYFLPKAHTCTNRLELPRPTLSVQLPEEVQLFKLFDYAFLNAYFGSL